MDDIEDPKSIILAKYLFVSMCCHCYVDATGRRFIDPLWARDLLEHTSYIAKFTIAIQRIDAKPPASFVEWTPALSSATQIIDLPAFIDLRLTILRLPALAKRLWKAIGDAEIVHSGVAGWPFPEGWLTIPIARLRKKFVIVIVESDFWRVSNNIQTVSFRKRFRAAISEILNRWCVGLAHVSFFTHEKYKSSLLTRQVNRGHVIPASWIDGKILYSEEESILLWRSKLETGKKLKLIIVGRLVEEKGVVCLLEALSLLQSEPGKIGCDILGEGPLLEFCKKAADKLSEKVEVKCLGTVEYGQPLFDLIAEYDAVVVPILSNEQPRIIYDAFARALPVLGFDSQGVASCVRDGVTGRLCPSGNIQQLTDLIEWAAEHRAELSRMGMAGLNEARTFTHVEMHRRRRDILIPLIEALSNK